MIQLLSPISPKHSAYWHSALGPLTSTPTGSLPRPSSNSEPHSLVMILKSHLTPCWGFWLCSNLRVLLWKVFSTRQTQADSTWETTSGHTEATTISSSFCPLMTWNGSAWNSHSARQLMQNLVHLFLIQNWGRGSSSSAWQALPKRKIPRYTMSHSTFLLFLVRASDSELRRRLSALARFVPAWQRQARELTWIPIHSARTTWDKQQ